MKKNFLLVGVCLAVFVRSDGQDKVNKSYRNFPVIITIQFHSLTLPFRDFKSNFSNVGFGVGTEVSFNGKRDWVQQFSATLNRNQTIGNGVLFSTQTVWRPTIVDQFYGEIKAGVGYNYCLRPVESYRPENGKWVTVGNKGKGMFTLLGGASAGYDNYSSSAYISPFVSYQFMVLKGYNKSFPIVPETVLQAGSRVHF
ncbi:MAG TPA: hypothetical protein VGQ53_10290 [Chitinophagaceae bacterium]|nr:hypothetical protein [Chitinophagaceae bacterium]